MKLFLRFSWMTLLLGIVAPLFGEESSIGIQSVRVGIEGIYKNGLWMPIDVEWSIPARSNTAVNVSVSSVDSDGTPIIYRRSFVAISRNPSESSGDRLFFREKVYANLGRRTAALTVEVDDGATTAKKTIFPSGNSLRTRKSEHGGGQDRFFEPVVCEKPVYLIVGNEDIGLQGAVAELTLREDRRPLLVKVSSFAELPDQWFGYEAVDTVVLTTTDPRQFEGLTSESPQIKALDDWIRLGGRLLFCAGKDAQPFLEPENGALRPFLPGRYTTMTELRENAPLEVFVDSKRQIVMNGTDEAPFLKMPLFEEPKGIVLLKHRDLTLVSRCAHGFGTIVYFGGDLAGRPLAVWRDRVALVRGILQWNTERPTAARTGVSLIQLGYNDISGQVRSALDRFDGVRVVPFSVILIILVVYWLVVGPFDWFFVQKMLKRPVLTWVTFPFWIVLFSGLAYYLALPGRPAKSMLNELTLVDLDCESNTVRCSSWGNVYSSRDQRFDFGLSAGKQFELKRGVLPSLFSWNGLPGSGLGGMAPNTVRPTVWQTGATQEFRTFYRQTCSGEIREMPVQTRSTKSFFGQAWAFNETIKSSERYSFNSGEDMARRYGFEATLADEEGIPVGRISMRQDMPVLENGILVYGRWVQELGTVQPGQAIEIGKKTPRRELRDLLMHQTVLEDDQLQRMASYNSQSTDPDYIVRVLSLYDVLGGFDAIGLYNAFQRSLDLSDLFSVDRAVLIGTVRHAGKPTGAPEFGSSITGEVLDGTRHVVFRQSLPITLTELSPRLKIERREYKKDDLEDRDKTIDPGAVRQKEQSTTGR